MDPLAANRKRLTVNYRAVRRILPRFPFLNYRYCLPSVEIIHFQEEGIKLS